MIKSKENLYTVASSCSSTTYGNVMAVFKELLLDNFPINFFKETRMTTEIAYFNIRRRLGRNTLREFTKLHKPYMVITPQIQVQNDGYLINIPLTKNYDIMQNGIQKNTLFPILDNRDDEYALGFKLNRDKIEFEININVHTLIQQIDLYKYMVNHMIWDRPHVIKHDLEAMIPRDMIKAMGKLSKIDLDSKNGKTQVPILLDILNKKSAYPITYKMRNGTAKDEFFMYYGAELLIEYSDISIDQGNKKGIAEDYFNISFRATIEFNLPGLFALIGYKPRPESLIVDLSVSEENGSTLIPLFTIDNFYSKYKDDTNGFRYYTSTRFQTESGPFGKDTLDITNIIKEEYMKCIHFYHSSNIPMGTIVSFKLLKDGVPVDQVDWRVNYSNMTLEVSNADDTATYCFIIYINNNLIMDYLDNVYEEKNNDKSRL